MKCQNCGGEISDSAKFCPLCGHKNTPVPTEITTESRQKETKIEKSVKKKRKAPIVVAIILVFAVVAIALFPMLKDTVLPQWKAGEYEKVSAYIENEDYDSADEILDTMTSLEKITGEDKNIDYYYAKISLKKGEYEKAIKEFETLGSFENSAELYKESIYQFSEVLIKEENFDEAINQLKILGDYKDSKTLLKNTENRVKYDEAVAEISDGDYKSAIRMLKSLGDYSDSKEQIAKCYYLLGEEQLENKEWDNAISSFKSAGDYKDSKEKITEVENARIQYWKNGVSIDFTTQNNFVTQGEFIVHSITAKLSDNEKNYTFVVDVTLPANMRVSFFNPPKGTVFMLVNKNAKEGRNSYTFTVSIDKIKTINSITVKFTIDDSADKRDYGYAFINNSELSQLYL